MFFGKRNKLIALNTRMGELANSGKFADAIAVALEGQALALSVYGKNHLAYAQSINNPAAMHQCAGNYDEAAKHLREAVALPRTTVGTSHTHYITSLFNLAQVFHFMRDDVSAEPLYREVLSIAEKQEGAPGFLVSASLKVLAEIDNAHRKRPKPDVAHEASGQTITPVETEYPRSEPSNEPRVQTDTDRELSPNGVFHPLANTNVDPSLVFVLMPFDPTLDILYQSLIKTGIERMGLRCLRADDIYRGEGIVAMIIENIQRASIILADLSKKNANVFYELGVAHTLGKKTFLVTQSYDDVPFDLRHLQILRYDNTLNGIFEFDQVFRKHFASFAGVRAPDESVEDARKRPLAPSKVADVQHLRREPPKQGLVFIDDDLFPDQINANLVSLFAGGISEGNSSTMVEDIFGFVESTQRRLQEAIDAVEHRYPDLQSVGTVFRGNPMIAAMHVGRRATHHCLAKTLAALEPCRGSASGLTAFKVFKDFGNALSDLAQGRFD